MKGRTVGNLPRSHAHFRSPPTNRFAVLREEEEPPWPFNLTPGRPGGSPLRGTLRPFLRRGPTDGPTDADPAQTRPDVGQQRRARWVPPPSFPNFNRLGLFWTQFGALSLFLCSSLGHPGAATMALGGGGSGRAGAGSEVRSARPPRRGSVPAGPGRAAGAKVVRCGAGQCGAGQGQPPRLPPPP